MYVTNQDSNSQPERYLHLVPMTTQTELSQTENICEKQKIKDLGLVSTNKSKVVIYNK